MDSKIPHGILRTVDPKTGEYLKEIELSTDDKGREVETEVIDFTKDLKALSSPDPQVLDAAFSDYPEQPESQKTPSHSRPSGPAGSKPDFSRLHRHEPAELVSDTEFSGDLLKEKNPFGSKFLISSAA